MVYLVEATHNEFNHIVPDHREAKDSLSNRRFDVGPNIALDWSPPTLIYVKGRKKIQPNLMAYDHDAAFTADADAIDRLDLAAASWCRLFAVRAEVLDSRFKPTGHLEFHLVAVTRLVDAVNREKTRFKPYGNEVFDSSFTGSNTVFDLEKLPTDGLFHHRNGNATVILTYDDDSRPEVSFKRRYEASGLIGLKFSPFGQAETTKSA